MNPERIARPGRPLRLHRVVSLELGNALAEVQLVVVKAQARRGPDLLAIHDHRRTIDHAADRIADECLPRVGVTGLVVRGVIKQNEPLTV